LPFEQYDEPANELPGDVRTFARMDVLFKEGDIVEHGEEAEAELE
jgi:hypothetical protein